MGAISLVIAGSVSASFVAIQPALAVDLETTPETPASAPATELRESSVVAQQLVAEAGNDRKVAIGRKVLFSASGSVIPQNAGTVQYWWDFGDGSPVQQGIDVVHDYANAGDFEVVLTIQTETYNSLSTDTLTVSVYEDITLLVADGTPTDEQLESIQRQALREGIYIDSLVRKGSDAGYIVEGELLDRLQSSKEQLASSSVILVWTQGTLGANVLLSLAARQEVDESPIDISNKGIVLVTDQPLSAVARIAQRAYDALRPGYILLVKPESVGDVVTARTPSEVLNNVQASDIESRLIGVYSGRGSELRWDNPVSYGVNLMINSGIAVENILLLLALPVIATIVAFARQVMGIKTFGIYTPSIIALVFVVSGLKIGLAAFFIVLLVATLARYVLRPLKLAYLPRMAIVLTAVAASIYFVLLVGATRDIASVTLVSIFPFLVLIMLVEKFVTAQVEKGSRAAVMLSVETILVAVVASWLVQWETFRTFILAYPEALLLVPILNLLIGRWRGLRVAEYFRFRSVRSSAGSETLYPVNTTITSTRSNAKKKGK